MSETPQGEQSPHIEVKLESGSVGHLEGKLLTIIDASTQDQIQRKALKDIVSVTLWDWAMEWQLAYTHEQWKRSQSIGS